jgi:4-amino-4-deoxy-L-arabinose transferase-like glycosyltransferase
MRLALPALLVLCALVLFSGLGRVGWTDAHEARDAEVARELIRHHEPITPLYGGDALFEKPVFAYAPEVIARLWSGKATASTPVRSRRLRVAAALALLLVTGAIATRRFGTRAGLWSAIALVTTLGVPFAVRADGTQTYATLLGWCACAAFASCLFAPARRTTLRLLGAWCALAIALVIAGPTAALWPPAGVALYAVLAGDRSAWSRIRPLAGAMMLLGIALPWYGAMVDRHGIPFLTHVLAFPYGVEAPGAWPMAPLLALTFVVVAFYPWSALLPEAMRHASTHWRSQRGASPAIVTSREGEPAPSPPPGAHGAHGDEPVLLWLLSTFVVALLPVALLAGAPMTAVLPALPAAAMLCGRLADHAFEDAAPLRNSIGHATRVLAIVGTLGALLLAIGAQRVPEAAADVRLLAAVTFVSAWLPLLFMWRDRPALAVALLTLPVAVGAPIATWFVLPDLEGYVNARVVATTMNEHTPAFAPLAVFEPPPPSLRAYVKRNLVLTTPSAERLREVRASDGYKIGRASCRERVYRHV